MALFDWFKGTSNIEVANDRIWLTKEAKLKGISLAVARALEDTNGPLAVVLVAHFADCVQDLHQLIQQGGFDARSVLVATAEDLAGFSTRLSDFGESSWIQMIVAQGHPLLSRDESLIEFARTLPCQCRISFHISLDEPQMQMFVGDWVKQILERLGMSENEALESRIVTRRIQKARKNIEKRATSDLPADSAEQWLERNCPTS